MFNRLRRWLLELLISLDQLGHVLCGGPKYIFRGGPCPSADETISSKVGRQAAKGRRWAIAAEKVINAGFRILGQRDHCRHAIEWDELA
jgi:hypothetical protein